MVMYIYEDNYYNFIERSLYLLQLYLAIFTMTSHAIFCENVTTNITCVTRGTEDKDYFTSDMS